MRWYEIYTQEGGVFRVECDEIVMKNDFFTESCKEPLCLFNGNRVVAIFKNWISFVDITEKQLNVL